MALAGVMTAGSPDEGGLTTDLRPSRPVNAVRSSLGRKIKGSSALFGKKNPGSPGKLGKSSSTAESLSKLRGKGALA